MNRFCKCRSNHEPMDYFPGLVDTEGTIKMYCRHCSGELTKEHLKVLLNGKHFKAGLTTSVDYEAFEAEDSELHQKAGNCVTYQHIDQVARLLVKVMGELSMRTLSHDRTKLESLEAEIFTKYSCLMRGMTFGSEEYNECKKLMKPALDHHYAHNRHHPNHFNLWKCGLCEREFTEMSEAGYCPECAPVNKGAIEEAKLQHIGINKMNLVDLLEMICDWKASTLLHDDGDIQKSIVSESKRFHISPQLVQILKNTVELLER